MIARIATHEAAATRWIADDVDESDQAELRRVLDDALAGDPLATSELAARMAGPLRFGTAGLRAPLRAGPAGMNRAVVVRTSAGLAGWLADRGQAGTVVLGWDARHRSEQFAADAAGVFGAAGFDVVLLPRPLPTPVLAFAARRLGAVAGIQITASHNPPGDNGYKVYLGGGTPIAPPIDAEIEAAIAAAPPAAAVPRDGPVHRGGEEFVEAYLRRVAQLPRASARQLRVVATPLHGVGGPVLIEALRRAGFTDVHLVPEQAEPDPDFPTVRFPNPEESGAVDALLALAAELDADLAIALDPDADRCALGTRDRAGQWRMLRGDESGVLLGAHILRAHILGAHSSGRSQQSDPLLATSTPLVATSIVSSSLLGKVATAHGARYAETPTGFKWLIRAGDGLVYAYEEALGHCVDPDAVRDKDGISAAVLACDLTASALACGHTLNDLLDELAIRHGVHLTDQVSVRLADHCAVAAVMAELRAAPSIQVDGHPVRVHDLRVHDLRQHPEHREQPQQPDDTLALHGDGFRVMVRPSGTEPKLKAYLEVVEPVPDPTTVVAAQRAAAHRLAAVRTTVSAALGTAISSALQSPAAPCFGAERRPST